MYIAPRAGAFDYVDISYEGSRTQDVLWLVDGMRITNRLYNTTTPIDTIPASMVERIEVLDGGQALMYGTQSSAGAVNIVTRSFSDRPDGAVSVGGDTNGGYHLNGYFRGGLGPNHLVLYASRDEADGFQQFRDQDYQPSSTDRERGYEVTTFGGKYSLQMSAALRASVLYQMTDATLDHTSQPKSIARAVNEREEQILSGKIDFIPGETFGLYVKGYYHWWDAYFSQKNTNLANLSQPIEISAREFWGFEDYGANLLAKLSPGGPLEYLAGFDYQHYTGQDDVLLIAREAETVQAPFAQLRTTGEFSSRVRLAAGVRHNAPDHGESKTVWNAQGHVDINPRLFARLNLGTAFRLPDAYELFAVDPCCEVGNPNLKPETSEYLNASIGGDFGASAGVQYHWELIGFARDITDLIAITFDAALGVDTQENSADTVEVRGGTFVFGAALANGLGANASVTLNDATMKGSSRQLQFIPERLAKLALEYQPQGRPFGFSATVNHVADVFRNLGLGREEFGNYTTVDVNGRMFLDAARHHRLSLKVENVFDTEYATRVGQTTPDAGGPAYVFWNLGMPQTVHASYTYEF
jgi:vitamin B12 transporter